jgi:hypothetical protein
MVMVFDKLTKKTFHAWIGAETSLFQDKYTTSSWFADDAVDMSLREGLKGLKIVSKGGKKHDKGSK